MPGFLKEKEDVIYKCFFSVEIEASRDFTGGGKDG
jgi:hypothetical protein